jgi:hypothetical protein
MALSRFKTADVFFKGLSKGGRFDGGHLRTLAQTLTPALGWMMEIMGRLQQNPRALMSLQRQDVLIWRQNAQ